MKQKLKSTHKQYKKKNGKQLYKQFDQVKEREKEIEKKSYLEALSNTLNIPGDVVAGAPLLMATGKHQINLENYKSIIEYNGNLIKIQTKMCKICIEGKNLNIDYFTDEEMRISGIIHSIHYI
ncbi:hypothetical protein lbkm_0959 [Lachnospiraceae bacterium KM106-2]|nr:hypothetical protein lbkm_0959 [Lachnospiraceae bacterium KM106-2]